MSKKREKGTSAKKAKPLLHLSKRQRRILRNAMAWCPIGFEPSTTAISELVDYVVLGKEEPATEDGQILLQGYCSHYNDPYMPVTDWILSKDKHPDTPPPSEPPSLWFYQSMYKQGFSWYELIRSIIGEARELSMPMYMLGPRLRVLNKMRAFAEHEIDIEESLAR